ncbi:MAG TPA: IS200/IS605 family transposase [Candidatus Sutterella merdavium]|jgi:putative transposase|nr:IS200/IS605 family transposase [Candidatus Sutterella merdavium]
MSGEYIHKQGLVYKNQFHVVFCPKYRRPVLVDGVDVRLKEILLEKAAELDVKILSMEIMPDHVHLFISFDPRLMLHKIIKILKGSSSRILREEFPSLKSRLPSLWTRSYFSCSVGHIGEAAVRRYIEEQKNV